MERMDVGDIAQTPFPGSSLVVTCAGVSEKTRSSCVEPAGHLDVKVNVYSLDLSRVVPSIEKFEVGVNLKMPKGDKDATKGPRLE